MLYPKKTTYEKIFFPNVNLLGQLQAREERQECISALTLPTFRWPIAWFQKKNGRSIRMAWPTTEPAI